MLPMLDVAFGPQPLALPFLAALALGAIGVGVAVASMRARVRDAALLAAFVAAMAALLLSQSVAAFMLSWEAMALISAFLVGTHAEQRYVRRALIAYAIVGQIGALCILAAFALLGAHAGSYDFAAIAASATTLAPGMRIAVALLAFVGFGSKAGLAPMHFWLPRAHPAAPAPASALLSGVMLAVALYGLALVGWSLAQPLPAAFGIGVTLIGAFGAVLGALYASVETDVKRLLAYSSVEQSGIAASVLGLAFAARAFDLPQLASLALLAFFFHVLVHAAFKSLLFLGAGRIVDATGTSDLEQLGGLMYTLRYSAPLIVLGGAAAAALPVTGGFAAEWLIFRGFIAALAAQHPALQIAALAAILALALAGGLALAAFAKFVGIGLLGRRRSEHVTAAERASAPFFGLAWFAGAIVVLGLVPDLALRVFGPIARTLAGVAPDPGGIAGLSRSLAIVPLLAAAATAWVARSRAIAWRPTWTCGSAVTRRAQYTATAFAKPLARIFAFALLPTRERTIERGDANFPSALRYETHLRYPIDEITRAASAAMQRWARRTRIVQGGRLRVYLAYAVIGACVLFWLAR